jgi:hypothetical protein
MGAMARPIKALIRRVFQCFAWTPRATGAERKFPIIWLAHLSPYSMTYKTLKTMGFGFQITVA